MHRTIPFAGVLIFAAPLLTSAQEPPVPSRELPATRAPANPNNTNANARANANAANPTPPPVIGSHQIDRYDAIANLQTTLQANPKSLADWVILGELAHEVAIDSPPDQAPRYFAMSRQAYEKALALAPDNAGLKAAVQFAKDQEANGAAFEKTRDQATASYLDARRRDLAASNYTPAIRVFTPPALMPVNPVSTENGLAANATTDPNPAVTNPPPATLATANMGTRQIYSTPVYRPYSLPQGSPYTFQQYSSAYSPPVAGAAAPITLQRYSQQYVNPLFNAFGTPARRVVPVVPAP